MSVSSPAHQEAIVLAASNKIVPSAEVSRPVHLQDIVGWFDADLEGNREINFFQLSLLRAGNCLTWMNSAVDEKTHLNNKDGKASKVEEME